MKICVKSDFFSYTSESLMWKYIGREWLKLGHNVTFLDISRPNIPRADANGIGKLYGDLLPFVSPQAKDNYDVYFDLFDFMTANLKPVKAKIYSGVFCWGLVPIQRELMWNVMVERRPIFVASSLTYKEFYKEVRHTYPFLSGVDHDTFNPDGPKKMIMQRDVETIFTWVGFNVPSSCPDIVFEAYFNEFSAKDKVQLVMVDPGGMTRFLCEEMDKLLGKDLPPVVFIVGGIDPEEMALLYRASTALILPVRFHCECRPILEAMSCGLPVVTNKYGGPADYTGISETIYIKYDVEPAIEASKLLEKKYKSISGNSFCSMYEGDKKFVWAKPDSIDLSRCMRRIHNRIYSLADYKESGKEMAAKWSWKLTALDMMKKIQLYR